MPEFTFLETLKKEHFLIERALRIMNILIIREQFLEKEFSLLYRLIKNFVEENHCAKEEKILFPLIREYEIDAQLIMVGEAEKRKEIIEDLEIGLKELDKEKIFLSLENFIETFARHIFKEEGLIFPACETLLPLDINEKIVEDFKEYEKNEENYEYFLKIVEDLEKLI
ncbi:MAG: hemerythrin domain-containing protein [candidate division WOR-3 bacterium]|nr:hemerythrin domain-containing protein [candidate division WOR-3 bacterium]MCX7836357.1 hemerythrin domain-containing protein [candidate division WOR-3 bacterium]MDW8113538.1 hemerythrin domain-containing protein [candidate division WOR-3 bacterium]